MAQLKRQQQLVQKEVATEAKLDTYLAQQASAAASVKAVSAALEKSRLDLSYTAMNAPFDGILVARYSEEFEEVTAQTPVLRLLDHRRIEMVIDVPERFVLIVPQIEDIRVSFTALGEQDFPATVAEFGAEASITTGTFPVTLIMDQPEGHLILPGMTGRARGTPKDENLLPSGVFLPAAAIFAPEGSDISQVWVVDTSSMTVAARAVELGAAGSLGIAIENGLAAGETVVTAGANSLQEGQKVSFLEGEK